MLTKLLKKYFPDSSITKFWENPRKRALVLLPLWIIFIAVLFIYFVIPYNKKNKKYNDYAQNLANETIPDDTNNSSDNLANMWDNLTKMDYEYKYVVYKNEDIIEYEGIKAENDVSGTKTDATGISEYYIQDDMVYNVINEQAIAYDTLTNIAYDKYLNPVFVYELVKEIKPEKMDSGYIYENGEDYVIISAGDYINSIEINILDTKYILNFMRID